MKPDLASLRCQIRTTETLPVPGCSSSTRDGFPPSSPSQVICFFVHTFISKGNDFVRKNNNNNKKTVGYVCTEGDGSGSFTLKSNGNEENGMLTKTAKYSIALQYLVLEGIANS